MADDRYSVRDPRRRKLWNFLWLNLMAIGGMLAIFYAVLYGDFLTGGFAGAWRWLSRHQVILVLAASTPFFAALLVGRASSARAKRKRLAEARRRAIEDAEGAAQRDGGGEGAGGADAPKD